MDKLTILIILAGVIVAELIALNVFLLLAIGKIKECAQNTDEQRSAVLKMVAMNSKTGMMGEQPTQNADAMKTQAPSQMSGQPAQPMGNMPSQPTQMPGQPAQMSGQPVQPMGNMSGQAFGNMNSQPMQMPAQGNIQPASLEVEKSVNKMPVGFEPEATIMIPRAAVKKEEEKAAQSTTEAKTEQKADNEDGTIICSNCYNPLPAYGKFCPNCSAVIEGR